ncbi:hypothetical protein QN089_15745 (plasmid) [Kurthia sp. YJT4]|uniref:hypothetical protein n=1 Tax=Kurthia TaxID=1649 RepID=UPI00254A5F74|nr:hypothetical protein [Kurthia sp. YJT4]WIL40252.1 hypothetical protein QN089_15745 [Kurthia sp. YJT4]
MSQKQIKNDDCSRRKEEAEVKLIQAKVAESRSKRIRNYCGAVGILVVAGIRLYLGV